MDAECRKTLRELRSAACCLNAFDPMLKHLTNYAIITSSGALEMEAKGIIADYVSLNGSVPIVKHIDKAIRRSSSNPSLWAIKKILDQFDMGWGDNFQSKVTALSEAYRQALGSLVAHRNDVAHGQSVSVAFGAVVGYYCKARAVIAKLEDVLV